MIGIALLAVTVLSQQAPLTADEIKERLDRPVTLQTDPARLPVVLDQLGSLVGVHIRSEALLNRAIVVVSVRNKPAKEVFARLVNGIGAGSMIQNGEIIVGMEVATPEEAAKLEAEYAQSLKGWSNALYKNRGCDDPIDQKALDRAAAQGLLDIQSSQQGTWRSFNQVIFQVLAKTPSARFGARLFKIVGPELLAENPDEESLYLSMRDLSEAKQGEVLKALGLLRQEQDSWAKTFAQLKALAVKTENYRLQPQIAEIEPMDPAALTGFKLSISRKDRSALVEVMSGNTPVLEFREYIPSKRQRGLRIEGERFDFYKAPTFTVPIGERPARYVAFLRPAPERLSQNDPELRRLLADPWKNEPLSFSGVQPLSQVAEKLGLNLVAFLSDQILYMLTYAQQPGKEVSNREVLSYVSFGGDRVELRKKDDWLVNGCYDPESYLRRQLDRAALGKFLSRAYKPGCLTFAEFCDARQALGRQHFQVAGTLAEIIQPGFQSLNNFALLMDFYSELNLAQRNQLAGGGIPIASLSPTARNAVMGIGMSFGGYRRPGDPEGLFTDPPTKTEMMRAKIVLRSRQSAGLLSRYNDNGDPNFYARYTTYAFQSLDDFQGQPARAIEILNALPSPFTRLCHRTERILSVDIPRKQGVKVAVYEFDADLTQASVPRERLLQPIIQYLGG